MAKQPAKTVKSKAETKPAAPAAPVAEKKPAAPVAEKKPVAAPVAEKKPAEKKVEKAPRKAPVKKPTAAQAPKSPPKKVDHKQVVTPEEHFSMVQDAAYYIAERNGFGGEDHRYWLEAEQYINDRYTVNR